MDPIQPAQRTTASDASTPSTPAATDSVEPTVLLPEPSLALADGSFTELAMLLTRADEQDRADARQLASAADQAALQDAQARVARLRDKADDEANAALLDGLARAAGGVCTGASGFFAPATGAADGCQCAPATGGAHGISFNWNSGFKGAGEMGPPIGELLAAPSQAAKGRADADAATFDAQAQAQIRRFERAQNDAQDANQSLERVESFLGQVQQAENATRLTAATYRA